MAERQWRWNQPLRLGGVYIGNNVITGNSASGVSPAAVGGGISMVNDSPAYIVQNLIYQNTADEGGGIYFLVPFGNQAGE